MAKLMKVTLGEGEAMTVRLSTGKVKKVVQGDIVSVPDDYKNVYLEPYKQEKAGQAEQAGQAGQAEQVGQAEKPKAEKQKGDK